MPGTAALRLARSEIVLFLREPVAVFFSVAFPLILLLFVGSVVGREEVDPGVRGIDAFFPTMIGVTAANVGVMGFAIHVAENRSRGVLRRLRLAPIRDGDYFVAQMLTAGAMLLLAVALLGVATFSFYGAPGSGWSPLNLVPLLGASFVVMYVMFSLGLIVGGLPMPVRSIQVLGASVFFLMFFSSGAAIPREGFPPWLETVSEINPLTHLNDFLLDAYLGRSPDGLLVVIGLVAAAVALNLVTRRTFDWEGRT